MDLGKRQKREKQRRDLEALSSMPGLKAMAKTSLLASRAILMTALELMDADESESLLKVVEDEKLDAKQLARMMVDMAADFLIESAKKKV